MRLTDEQKDFDKLVRGEDWDKPLMKKTMILSICEIVGSSLCVASEDGQKIHDRIATTLKEGNNITLSFLNVCSLTAAFLNAAIGQLYGSYTENQIRSMVKIKDIQPDDLALLRRVVETAKQYFKDPKRFNEAVRTPPMGGRNLSFHPWRFRMNKKVRRKEEWDYASLEWIHRARAQIYEAEKKRPLPELTPRLSPEAEAIARRLKLKTIRAADLPKRRSQSR